MSGSAGVTHDYTLEDTDGSNKKGFMYARRRNGSRPFVIQEAETIAPRFLTQGAMEHAEFPPAIEMISFQHDWVGGIGGIRELKSESIFDFHFLASANKIDASIDGRLRLAQELRTTSLDSAADAGKPTGFAIVGTELWAFIGRDVYSWDFTNGDWEIGTEPVAATVLYRNGIEFNGDTFVPCWNITGLTPNRYIHKADADANWTRIGAGAGVEPNGAKFFAKGQNANNAEILWGGYIQRADATFGANIVVSSTDPTSTANWSGETAIGASDSEINNLLIGETGRLLIFKTNGVWTLETNGTVTNITPTFEYRTHEDNFKAATVWNNRVLASVGEDGLIELSTGGGSAQYHYRNISLKFSLPEQTQFHGRVVAIHGSTDFVFLLVHDSTNTQYHLLKGQLLDNDYRWHCIQTISYTTSTIEEEAQLFVEGIDGVTKHDRLWVGIFDSGANKNPLAYPLTDEDTDWGYTNDTDAEAITVKIDFGLPRVPKRFEGADFNVLGLGSGGRQLAIDTRLDDVTAWTNWVTVNESPQVSRDFPAATTGKILELRIKPSQSSVSIATPEVISVRIRGQLRPESVNMLPMTAYLADDQELLNGSLSTSSKGDRSQLRTWKNAPAEVILRTPDKGQVRHVVFWPGTYQEEERVIEFGRRAETLVTFVLADVRDFQTGALWDEFVWDQALWS